jgi:hypothetical protein
MEAGRAATTGGPWRIPVTKREESQKSGQVANSSRNAAPWEELVEGSESWSAPPVLDAYERVIDGNVVAWWVWCDWCECFHIHGVGPGHRNAHCLPQVGSPYDLIGYRLRLAGQLPRGVRQKGRRWDPRRWASE